MPFQIQTQQQQIRVLIVDDHAILRKGLIEILTREMDTVICGEAKNAEQALGLCRNRDWNLVILDIAMPGRSGLDLLRDLKREKPLLPVLILSMYPEDQFAKRMFQAGASGY